MDPIMLQELYFALKMSKNRKVEGTSGGELIVNGKCIFMEVN